MDSVTKYKGSRNCSGSKGHAVVQSHNSSRGICEILAQHSLKSYLKAVIEFFASQQPLAIAQGQNTSLACFWLIFLVIVANQHEVNFTAHFSVNRLPMTGESSFVCFSSALLITGFMICPGFKCDLKLGWFVFVLVRFSLRKRSKQKLKNRKTTPPKCTRKCTKS